MDDIFCKSFACYNGVLKQPREGSRAGAFRDFIPRPALARRLAQAIFFFRGVICILAAGFRDCLARRRRPPGSTPITSPDQHQWPSQPSRRVHVIRAREADKAIDVSTSRIGVLRAIFFFGVVACVLDGLYRRPNPVPRSIGYPGTDHIASKLVCVPLPAPSQSTGVGDLGGLPGRRRRSEPLLLTRCVCHDIFFLGDVVCALAGIYKRLTTQAIGLPRRSGDAGDAIVTLTPEFEKSTINASGAAIPCGSHSTGSAGASDGLGHDIFFGSVVCLVAPPAIDLARSTGDAGGDIIPWTPESDASRAAILGGGHSGSSWLTRPIFDLERGLKWPNTFKLNCSALGQPIGPVTRCKSWEAYLGRPMKQRKKDTCALVACTVAVDAMHRCKYAKDNGTDKQFPWTVAEPDRLFEVCKNEGIWTRGNGASVRAVLDKIKHRGGVHIANPQEPELGVLPLSSWKDHWGDAVSGLSSRCVAELLDGGPCVGRLWTCPWYSYFNASLDDGAWVYRGCGRSQADRDESESLYRDTGSHAVVCFGYRLCGDGQMHVLVLDNQEEGGPWRWIDVEEILTIYTLDVYYDPLLRPYGTS
ncbi:hypothetical protein ACP70R_042052 [Stipagrostis hirtigluma subsp. patula]